MLLHLQCLLLLLCWSCSFQRASSSLNLDPLSPTVVSSGLASSSIDFGWDLAQHTSNNGQKSVLVSTPRANGSSLREGGVYSCPFDNRETCQFQPQFQDRTVSMLDPFGDDTGLSRNDVSFEGQLMGFSLRSLPDRTVIACAPLYVDSVLERVTVGGINYFIGAVNGRCIVLSSNLSSTVFQAYSESVGELFLGGLDAALIQPLNVAEQLLVISNSFGGENPREGQINLASISQSMEVGQSATNTVPLDALLGFHMETGRFTMTAPQIATSSPRSLDHRGKVDIWRVVRSSAQNLQVSVEVVHTLEGEEVNGYFGYDFAVLALREDGLESLVVGCPLCDRERGRVYVYANTGSMTTPFFVRSVLDAPGEGRGRFGLTVENIGDIDLDGLPDVAVGAPFQGRGVVYIYRGSETGVVSKDYQTIPALDGTRVFGFSLSGGLDIDNNSYPDITVGDLQGGRVTSFRSSPVVNVTVTVKDRKEVLDLVGNSDRLCPHPNNITLHCFNITPCFYYEPKNAMVPKFAINYSIVVDEEKSRVRLYTLLPGGEIQFSESRYSKVLNLTGSGSENTICGETLTFALNEDLVDPSPIPVTLSVDDAPEPLALEPEPALEHFGSPLHPVLMKYIRGDTPAPITLNYLVDLEQNCSSGNPSICEGDLTLTVSDLLNTSKMVDGRLVLAVSNEFGYEIRVTNVATEPSFNPTLLIQLPLNTRVSRTEPPVLCNSRNNETGGTVSAECVVTNLLPSNRTFTLRTFFAVTDTTALLEQRQLDIRIAVRDGGSRLVSLVKNLIVPLEAVGGLTLSSRVASVEYKAFRSAVIFPNKSALTLTQVGPRVVVRVIAQNNRDSSSGTTFPRSTVRIYFPVQALGSSGRVRSSQGVPLLIPLSVLTSRSSDSVNCSHYNAIPPGLSPAQRPVDFIRAWGGAPPARNPECESEGKYECGVIICIITDLHPLPEPPTEITLFSRLYSPSISTRKEVVKVYSSITTDTPLPRIEDDSVTNTTVMFTLAPGPQERQRVCVDYWVVVVSVVIGISFLLIIVAIVASCVLIRRCYKKRQEEQHDGTEGIDNEMMTFQRRAVPPIPGLTNGAAAPLPSPSRKNQGGGLEDHGLDKDLEKMHEAEAELQEELRRMAEAKAVDKDDPSILDPKSPDSITDARFSYKEDLGGLGLDSNLCGTDLGEGTETDL